MQSVRIQNVYSETVQKTRNFHWQPSRSENHKTHVRQYFGFHRSAVTKRTFLLEQR